ncbi:ankyrin repeat, SAM and basic leucine zipper domain-containing protein 1 [Setaria italica]|uniref:ankyrin repeat, SAM and basic leucine zipper domain-containing protein 1 n=1 Tax=Setaria italica TaxID=4555 RepID=UPI000350D4B6|nr:ankyrin repeat, SAM and basic leucine zipper domain-containing protein 1 [Setaria italica]
MAPSRAASSRSTPDAASSGWFSSLRPPLDLKPALLPEDADDDDDRAVAELLDAALEGDLARSKKLAKQLMSKAGMSVDEAVADAAVGVTGIKRRGPLHLAAANGKVEVCKFLIRSCEVDVDAADADGSYEVAELLLSKEAEVDPICENGGAPIHVSAENGHAKVLKLLLQHKADAGADVNAGSPLTPLVIAAGKGLTNCVKCLLKAGADANIPDENGKLPVQIAARQGWKECVKIPVNPVAQYADWSIDGIIQHEKTALDSDDKENAISDINITKVTLPDLPESFSEKRTALTMVEENGGGIESLMSDFNLGPEDPTDKASSVQERLPLRRSTRARQPNVRISGPEWAR